MKAGKVQVHLDSLYWGRNAPVSRPAKNGRKDFRFIMSSEKGDRGKEGENGTSILKRGGWRV